MAYQVGDVVNGHRLGEDNQWHPVESLVADDAGATTDGQPAQRPPDSGSPDGSSPDGAVPLPWYRRREVIAAAAIVVVALVIGFFLRRGDEVATTASSVQQPAVTVSAQPAPATPTAEAVPAPSPSPAPAATRAPTATRPPAVSSAPAPAPSPTASAVRTPTASASVAPVAPAAGGLNTVVRDGTFDFTVTDVKCGQSQVGSEFLNKLPQGQFCLVSMTVANTGSQAQVFDGAHQKALVGERTIQADTEAAWYIEESKSFLEPVEPGKKAQGAIVFDIPKASVITELRLHHSASSNGAKVKVS